ncbi:hypothetical protein [Moraxella ovis]|uniref:hypothetical protein n=1 Tax=Moraxella ovis TaxID=29433 RepID=UPI000A013945|nr:hypothetical protein [Moraxella ovis]
MTKFKLVDKQGNTKKLYLSPINHLFKEDIISYQMYISPNYDLVSKILDQAPKRRQAGGNGSNHHQMFMHSDQG